MMAARARDERAAASVNTAQREATTSAASWIEGDMVAEMGMWEDAPPLTGVAGGEEAEEPSKKRKSGGGKRVSFPPEDRIAQIKTYVPENPSQMVSTRAMNLHNVRQLAKMDARHERDLKTLKSEEASAREGARKMEPQISWLVCLFCLFSN